MSRKWTDEDDRLRKAAMDAKWNDFRRTAEFRPYAQMQSVGDNRDHPECTALDGIIVRLDNPWLSAHWPPHRKQCRCTVRTLNDRQLQRDGLAVTPDAVLP